MEKVMILEALKTPSGIKQLNGISEQKLASELLSEIVKRSKLDAKEINEIILGTARQTSVPSNCARHASLLAKLPVEIPAYTVQRQSASGMQAIANGFWNIKSGNHKMIIAGGTESTSSVPLEIHDARFDFSEGKRVITDSMLEQQYASQPEELYGRIDLEKLTENLKNHFRIEKEELYHFIEDDHKKALSFTGEESDTGYTVPIEQKIGKKTLITQSDEMMTNSLHDVVPYGDGSAICLMSDEETSKKLSIEPLCELASMAVAAGNPALAGEEAIAAIMDTVCKANLSLADMDAIEISVLTASQGLLISRALEAKGIPKEKINPMGSSISYGNPQGASGVLSLTKMAHQIKKNRYKNVLCVVCAEGAQTMAACLCSIKKGS